MTEEGEAFRQCTHEVKTLLHRWEEESDLHQEDILECVREALREYYNEDVIDFEPEIDPDE